MTPEQQACLKAVSAAGGIVDQEGPELAPFCDDRAETDVFNQCVAAGWLRASHDTNTDIGLASLTAVGRAALRFAEEVSA